MFQWTIIHIFCASLQAHFFLFLTVVQRSYSETANTKVEYGKGSYFVYCLAQNCTLKACPSLQKAFLLASMRVILKAKAYSQQGLGLLYEAFLNISSLIGAVFHILWDLLTVSYNALVHLSIHSIFRVIPVDYDCFSGHQTFYHKSQHANESILLSVSLYYQALFAFSQWIHVLAFFSFFLIRNIFISII